MPEDKDDKQNGTVDPNQSTEPQKGKQDDPNRSTGDAGDRDAEIKALRQEAAQHRVAKKEALAKLEELQKQFDDAQVIIKNRDAEFSEFKKKFEAEISEKGELKKQIEEFRTAERQSILANFPKDLQEKYKDKTTDELKEFYEVWTAANGNKKSSENPKGDDNTEPKKVTLEDLINMQATNPEQSAKLLQTVKIR